MSPGYLVLAAAYILGVPLLVVLEVAYVKKLRAHWDNAD